MIREYLVAAAFTVDVPEGEDPSNFIIEDLAKSLSSMSKENVDSYLKSIFSVIEGDEIVMEDEED